MATRGPKARTPANSAPSKRKGVAKGDITPPPHLEGVGRDEYRRLADVLKSAGTLDRTDTRLIELYAVNYALLRRAQEDLARDGATIKTKRGAVIPHPMIGVMNAATIRLRGMIADLGLSPATSRHSGAGESSGVEDAWGDLLSITG